MKKYDVFVNIEDECGNRNDCLRVESTSETHARFDAAKRVLKEIKGVISVTCLDVCEA